jgi:hypothetical protein
MNLKRVRNFLIPLKQNAAKGAALVFLLGIKFLRNTV